MPASTTETHHPTSRTPTSTAAAISIATTDPVTEARRTPASRPATKPITARAAAASIPRLPVTRPAPYALFEADLRPRPQPFELSPLHENLRPGTVLALVHRTLQDAQALLEAAQRSQLLHATRFTQEYIYYIRAESLHDTTPPPAPSSSLSPDILKNHSAPFSPRLAPHHLCTCQCPEKNHSSLHNFTRGIPTVSSISPQPPHGTFIHRTSIRSRRLR